MPMNIIVFVKLFADHIPTELFALTFTVNNPEGNDVIRIAASSSTSSHLPSMGSNLVLAPRMSQPGPEPADLHDQHDPHAMLEPSRLLKVALQHERDGRHELALEILADPSLYKVWDAL